MKLYTYETLDGDITIEVDEKWHEWLTESDKEFELQDRSHTRPDHKYAPGAPVSLDTADSLDDWLVFSALTSYAAVELKIDLELALELLTPLQRRYFIMNRLRGLPTREIARREGKWQTAIMAPVLQADKKIKKFFRG